MGSTALVGSAASSLSAGAPVTDEAAAYGQCAMTRSCELARHHGTILLVLQCLFICSVALQAAEAPLPVYIQADYMERHPARNLLRFQGAVDIKYGDSHLTADTVELNTETGDGTAE